MIHCDDWRQLVGGQVQVTATAMVKDSYQHDASALKTEAEDKREASHERSEEEGASLSTVKDA